MSSLGRQAMTSFVISVLTNVSMDRLSAMTRIARSRSVRVPIAFPDASHTGKNPTFRSRILHAATWAVSVGERHATSSIMMSSQSMWYLLDLLSATSQTVETRFTVDGRVCGTQRRGLAGDGGHHSHQIIPIHGLFEISRGSQGDGFVFRLISRGKEHNGNAAPTCLPLHASDHLGAVQHRHGPVEQDQAGR